MSSGEHAEAQAEGLLFFTNLAMHYDEQLCVCRMGRSNSFTG